MTKKPVKKSAFSAAQMKELLFLLNHEGLHAQEVSKQLWDAVKTTASRLDGAWGKIITLTHYQENHRQRVETLESRVDGTQRDVGRLRDQPSMYPPGFAAELTARSKALLDKGEFCVIGDQAKNGFGGNIGRTWKGTQEQAEAHAESIHRNHPGCPELLVVKVVSKVGRKEPDIKITRV